MEAEAASALGLFFAQYGALGAVMATLISLAGIFTVLWLRVSKELRQDNDGRITSQSAEIRELEKDRDRWRDRYYTERARSLGLHDEDSESESVT